MASSIKFSIIIVNACRHLELNEKTVERHLVYSKPSKIIDNIFEVWIVKPRTNITYFLILSGNHLFDHVSSLVSGFKFKI